MSYSSLSIWVSTLYSILRSSLNSDASSDVHSRLMLAYKEGKHGCLPSHSVTHLLLSVPEWWYLSVFLVTLIMALVHAEVYDTGLPVRSLRRRAPCLTVADLRRAGVE